MILISKGLLLSNWKFKVISIQLRRYVTAPITFMHYLRLHTGGESCVKNAAEFTSTCVHAAVALPSSSKPMSQL